MTENSRKHQNAAEEKKRERQVQDREEREKKWEMGVRKGVGEDEGVTERQCSTQGKKKEKRRKGGSKGEVRKERAKSWGNNSCCPSTLLLLLQVSDEFLLFCFLDAISCISNPSMFLSGGLSSFPAWIKGIGGAKRKKKREKKCIFI